MPDQKDKKFMDVAKKPEEATADIGAKPMIVGHKAESDPMMKESSAENETSTPEKGEEAKLVPPSQKLRQVAPLATEASTEVIDKEKAPIEKSDEATVKAGELSTQTPPDKKQDKAELDPVAVEMEKQEELHKLVESKKYLVSVKQARNTNPLVTVIVLLLVFLVGLGTVFYLIDTKKLDLGFTLPFSIFGKKDAQTPPSTTPPAELSSEPPVAPATEVEKTTGDETVAYASAPYSISFDYPKSWGDVTIEQVKGFSDQKYETEVPYYLSIAFSAQKNVTIHVVNGRAFEGGRDFLGPLGAVDALVSFYHNYAISYKKLTSGGYELARVSTENVEKNVSSEALLPTLYTFKEEGSTLVIQPAWTLDNLALLPWDSEESGMTQKEAESQLAEKNKQSMFVRNYSTKTVQGINASYVWSSDQKDTVVETALLELVNSIK